MCLRHVWQKVRIIPTLTLKKLDCSVIITFYFCRCRKKQLLCWLRSGTKHTSISKKYCRLIAITEVLRKNFTWVGAYSVKYISVNILNKTLQMAVPKTSDYNQNKGVPRETAVFSLWQCQWTWTLLQTQTEYFWSWYTEWQFGQLLFQMFSHRQKPWPCITMLPVLVLDHN